MSGKNGKSAAVAGACKSGVSFVSKLIGGSSKLSAENELHYYTVEKLTESELKTAKKKKVEVNGKTIVLIYHEDKIYAIQEKCPHYGGPLYQGDIEDLPPDGACIRCPWHSWKFSLTSGKCISPQREDKCLKIYPVKITKLSKEIKVGFEKDTENESAPVEEPPS